MSPGGPKPARLAVPPGTRREHRGQLDQGYSRRPSPDHKIEIFADFHRFVESAKGIPNRPRNQESLIAEGKPEPAGTEIGGDRVDPNPARAVVGEAEPEVPNGRLARG